jgi:hypothetical protein
MTFPEHLAYRLYGFLVLTLTDAGYAVKEGRIGDMQFFIVSKDSMARAVFLTLAPTLDAAHEDLPVVAPELEYLTVPAIRAGAYADAATEHAVLVLPEELGIPAGAPVGDDFVFRLGRWLRRSKQGDLSKYRIETRKRSPP